MHTEDAAAWMELGLVLFPKGNKLALFPNKTTQAVICRPLGRCNSLLEFNSGAGWEVILLSIQLNSLLLSTHQLSCGHAQMPDFALNGKIGE